MFNNNLQLGDVVELQSGSGEMTIIASGRDGLCACCGWWDEASGGVRSQDIHPAALKFVRRAALNSSLSGQIERTVVPGV